MRQDILPDELSEPSRIRGRVWRRRVETIRQPTIIKEQGVFE